MDWEFFASLTKLFLEELNNTIEDYFVHFIELNIEICSDGSGILQYSPLEFCSQNQLASPNMSNWKQTNPNSFFRAI